MPWFNEEILTVLLVFPALWALPTLIVKNDTFARYWALAGMIIFFGLSLQLLSLYTAQLGSQEHGFIFFKQVPWLPEIGASYTVGIDGVSIWLIMLTALFGPIAVLSSFKSLPTACRPF